MNTRPSLFPFLPSTNGNGRFRTGRKEGARVFTYPVPTYVGNLRLQDFLPCLIETRWAGLRRAFLVLHSAICQSNLTRKSTSPTTGVVYPRVDKFKDCCTATMDERKTLGKKRSYQGFTKTSVKRAMIDIPDPYSYSTYGGHEPRVLTYM